MQNQHAVDLYKINHTPELIAVIAHTEHSINSNRLVPKVQSSIAKTASKQNHSTKWELIAIMGQTHAKHATKRHTDVYNYIK